MTFLLASETDKDLGDWTEVEGGESIGPFVRSVENLIRAKKTIRYN